MFILSFVIYTFSEVVVYFRNDTSKPVIESRENVIKVRCDYSQDEILEGLTAHDKQDGDLTKEIMVGSISRFVEYGQSNVTYAVFDSSKQPATYTRRVIFEDYRSPEVTLANPLVIKTNSSVDENNLVGATDIFDGDISSRVKITENNVNYSVAGKYGIKVEFSNSFGDIVEQELPVHVVTEPETRVDITLKNNVLYLEKGEKLAPEKYVQSVTSFYGSPMDKSGVEINSYVNVNKAGTYEVEYRATDDTGNRGVTYMLVIVTEKGETK